MKTFDSLEEMFAAEEAAQKVADAAVTPAQASLKTGDFFIRYHAEYDIVIYGEVQESEEGSMGSYRFARCYSVACPEGEYGDIHVSTVTSIIGRSQFETAKAAGWPSSLEALKTILRTAVDRN